MEKQAPDGWKFNKNKIRYVLIEALCLVIVGELFLFSMHIFLGYNY